MNDLKTKLKSFEDKDKTEVQRLGEAAEEAKTRAAKAEGNARRLQTAIDRAPEGASLTQIKAVAKRLHGETDEELESDADELFELLTPKQDNKKSMPGKPKENLSGGGDPGEEPDERDPRKLADLIGRH
jgi:DNA-binding FrmR family transcriptional regulator